MLIYSSYKFSINQDAWLLNSEMQAPKPAVACGSLVGLCHSLLPFPTAPREWRVAHGVSRGRSLSLLTRAHTLPSDLVPLHTLNLHPLQLGTWKSPHHKHGLGASCIPASFPLAAEEDPVCSSGNLLWHRSEVMCKWGMSYFHNLESVEGGTFRSKSGKHSSREEYSQKQMAPLVRSWVLRSFISGESKGWHSPSLFPSLRLGFVRT